MWKRKKILNETKSDYIVWVSSYGNAVGYKKKNIMWSRITLLPLTKQAKICIISDITRRINIIYDANITWRKYSLGVRNMLSIFYIRYVARINWHISKFSNDGLQGIGKEVVLNVISAFLIRKLILNWKRILCVHV